MALPPTTSSLLFPPSTAVPSTPTGFPAPTFQPAANPFTFVDPSLGLPDMAERRRAVEQQAQMATLAKLGLAPETNPTTWTPETAAAQTDAAIAKIASVNPEAAQRLMDERSPEEDSGDSFWDNIKDVAGDILAPALSVGGKVFDLIGRTANIVPNLAFDAVDGGDFDFGGDVGGALTGNMRHNWNSVFQEMGWEGDGISGFLRASLGLVGDIGTDPLTWLIPAGAGVKASEAAFQAGTKLAPRAATMVARGAAVFGETGEALITKMDDAIRVLESSGVKAGMDITDDIAERVYGVAGHMVKKEQRDLLSDLVTIQGDTYRAVQGRSTAKFFKHGTVELSDGTLLKGAELKEAAEGIIKNGNWSKLGGKGSQWEQARQMASIVGGTRAKVIMPFTSFRYISPAIPGSKFITEKTVGAFMRYGAGQAGLNRMTSYIFEHNLPGGMRNAATYMEGGFEKAFAENPAMMTAIKGKFKNLGSMFYSGSEAMGRITANFTEGAVAKRAGLGGYLGVREALAAKGAAQQFANDLAYNVTMPDGSEIDKIGLLREMEANLRISYRASKNTATPEELQRFARYIDMFPANVDPLDPQALEEWFWSVNSRAKAREVAPGDAPYGQHLGGDEVAKAEAKLQKMKDTVAALTPAEKQTLDKVRTIWDHMQREAAKRDVPLADVRIDYAHTGTLTAEQAAEWGAGSHPLMEQTFWLDISDPAAALRMRTHGVTADDLLPTDEGIVGLKATRQAGGGAGVTSRGQAIEVRVKGKDWTVIDHREGAVLSDEERLIEASEGFKQAMNDTAEASDAAIGRNTGDVLSEKEVNARAAHGTTEDLRARYPESSGVMEIDANGNVSLTVFDDQAVKVIGNTPVLHQRGFLHRTFTPAGKEWVRGALPKSGKRLLVTEGELESFLRRETIHLDIDEAEAEVRRQLVEKYGFDASTLPERLFENDLLKVHQDYVDKTAEAILSEQLGKASRRLTQLGDLSPAVFGTAPREQKYEWMLDPGTLRSLQKMDTKLTNKILESHARDAKLMDESHRQLADQAERYGVFQAMLEESLAGGVEVPDRLVAAARRYGTEVDGALGKIDKERVAIDEQVTTLTDHIQSYDDAERVISGDPGVGHPTHEEPVRVTQLGDGRQRIQGYHGRIDATDPDQVKWPDAPEDLSNGGVHFGTWQQAKDRVDSLVGSTPGLNKDGEYVLERSIGFRNDPTSWPKDPVTDLPVVPDLFYEDHIFKVEAEGRFFGADEGGQELIPGEQEIGALSGTGQASEAAKKERALWSKDHDGVVYQNDPANGAADGELGQSVVVFDPENFHSAEGPARFLKAVEDGKVYRAPDGSVSTKRVAGSKRLVARSDAEAQLDELSKRRKELDGLANSLRRGDDAVERPNAPRPPRAKMEIPGTFKVGQRYETGRNVGRNQLPLTIKHAGQGQFELQAGTGEGLLSLQLTPEGDFQVFGAEVAENAQKQGIGTDMYLAAAELADKYGGVLLSDNPGSVSPAAERLWKSMSKKGYDVGQEKHAGGFIWTLQHHEPDLPSTRKVAEAGAGLARETAARAKREAQSAYAEGSRMARTKAATTRAMSEANKAYTEFHGAVSKVKPALVKVETAGNLEGLTRLHIPGLEGYAMPDYIAAEFHNIIDTQGVGSLRTAWRHHVMGPWKRWATYRWPGFHVRNFFGAWFNNFLGGVTTKDYVFSWRVNHARDGVKKWADKAVSPEEMSRYGLDALYGGRIPTYSELADAAAEHGLSRANTMTVMGIGEANEFNEEAFRAVGKANPTRARRAARKVDGKLRDMGSSVEDFHRIAAWGQGLAQTGGDEYGARAFVMMRHGDYSDLTGAEDCVRDLVPFYKWMRTNIPYQFRMLAENPAGLTITKKIKSYAYDVQGIDQTAAEMQQPDWMKQSLTVPIPSWVPVVGSKDKDALKFAMFDLPYTDLYNGLGDYLSAGLPVARNFLESYGVKQQVFSGVPLTGEYKPLSGVFNIPGVRDVLHAFHLTKRGEDGQEYIKDQVENVLTAFPIFSRFRNFTSADPSRVDNRVGGLFSMMAGVGIRQGDYTQAELDFFYNDVEPLLAEYKSLGIQLPTVDDIQSADAGLLTGVTGSTDTPSPFLAA